MKKDMEEGFEKMQSDFKKFGEKIIPPKNAAEDEVNNPANTQTANLDAYISEVGSSQVTEAQSETIGNQMQKNWDNFTNSAQGILGKWQSDWNTIHQANMTKIKEGNQKMKAQFEENNAKAQEFFVNQQTEFNTKIKKMETDFKETDQANKEQSQKTMALMENSWNTFVTGQKRGYDRFATFSNRLWWKGYINFLMWMIFIIAIVAGILKLFQYFEIY